MIFVGDLGLFELARGEPLVFFAQLGGDLGDGLLIFERQLGAAQDRTSAPPRSARGRRRASASVAFSSSGVVDLSAIAFSRVASVPATIRRRNGRVFGQDERLVVPELGVDGPADETPRRAPIFRPSMPARGFACVAFGVENLFDLVVRVREA